MNRTIARAQFIVFLLGSTAVLSPAAAMAQTGNAPPPTPTTTPVASRSFVPVDFARYSPKTALDMVEQTPGFAIRSDVRMRGLGQATDNVLLNGERPSSKSDDIYSQLRRIPAASVIRIEIVDAATLNIPGLSGQVANIVYKTSTKSGQFSYSPEYRPYNTDPLLTRGSVSMTGTTGDLKYEVGLNNEDSGRSGADGPTRIYDAAGTITEFRDDSWNTHYDSPKLSGKLTWDGPGSTVANVNAQYQRIFDLYEETGFRSSPGLVDRVRTVDQRAKYWNFEVGGDLDFAVGPGRLKLIGLRSFSHEPFYQDIFTDYEDSTPRIGDRYFQRGKLGETIGRGEYNWKMLGGDWQLSAEAAFNTLDSIGALGVLGPDDEFVETPYEGAIGRIKEDRYESLLSYSRQLGPKWSIQLVGGAEHSTIVQTGANGLSRSFFRPKGSLAISWQPSADLDVSFKIRRRVLQLNFYDFLARSFIDDGNTNAGNNDLRPQQDWSYEGEINKKLGPWGSAQVRFVYRDVEDYVDIVPVEGGESVGNIAKSWAAAIVPSATITFDPIGLVGVKLDASVVLQKSGLRDPFTGEKRQWSGFTNRQANLSLRHDVFGTDWAWGASGSHNHVLPSYRSNSIDRAWEGPWFVSAFVEHKNVMGMTVQGTVGNLIGARSYRDRTVWEGLRGASPIDFIEKRDRRIGPIVNVSLRGNF